MICNKYYFYWTQLKCTLLVRRSNKITSNKITSQLNAQERNLLFTYFKNPYVINTIIQHNC